MFTIFYKLDTAAEQRSKSVTTAKISDARNHVVDSRSEKQKTDEQAIANTNIYLCNAK
jgi:hypothetical protein